MGPSCLEYDWFFPESVRQAAHTYQSSGDPRTVETEEELTKDKDENIIIPLLEVMGYSLESLARAKRSLTLIWLPSLPQTPTSCVKLDMNLRKRGILPPPGHADCEQVIDGGDILEAGLASFGLVRKTTDDRLAARLDKHTGTHQAGGHDKWTAFVWFFFMEGYCERTSHHGFCDEQQQNSFLHHVLRTEATARVKKEGGNSTNDGLVSLSGTHWSSLLFHW